jgi:predicted metal-dependent phosphoesterase TrpH
MTYAYRSTHPHKQGSRCNSLDTKDLVKQAKKMHLDAVCITDHNTARAVEMVRTVGKEHGLLVFGGMEVRCREGDVLTFGLHEPPGSGIAVLDLLELIQKFGGAAIVAHPFRASAPSLGRKIWRFQFQCP